MNATAIPGFGTVVRQQLRLLWLSRRPQMLAVLMVGALLMMRALVWWVDTQFGADVDVLFAQVPALLLIIGGGWALIVWRDDPPKLRRYHWSMPVDVTQHDLARVLAGAVWLLAAISVYYLAGSLLAVIDGGAIELRRTAGELALYFALAPLLAYTLLSTIGVVSNRPMEWVLGLFFGTEALVIIMLLINQDHVIPRLFEEVFGGSWGLAVALSGAAPSTLPGTDAGSVYTEWLPVVLLWLAVGNVLLTLFALRRRGRA